MKAPHAIDIRRADRASKKDIERSKVRVRVGSSRGREQVVGRQPSSLEGAMIGGETTNGFRVLHRRDS